MTRASSRVPVCLAFFRRRENASRITPLDTIDAKSRMSTSVTSCLPETSQNPREFSR
jgi:hypothetical protein